MRSTLFVLLAWLTSTVAGCMAPMRHDRPSLLPEAPNATLVAQEDAAPPEAGPQEAGPQDAGPQEAGSAEAGEAASASGLGPWSAGASIGLTSDPGTFLMGLSGEIDLSPELRIGPWLRLGVADNVVLVAPSVAATYRVELSGISERLQRFHPTMSLGAGLAYIHKDRGRGNIDDVGLLIHPGFGAEFDIDDRVALGTHFVFDILPIDTAGENFFFSWQALALRVRF